jgi:hypothetical protein
LGVLAGTCGCDQGRTPPVPDPDAAPTLTPRTSGTGDASDHTDNGHGQRTDLGGVSIGGHVLRVARLGELEADRESALEIQFAGEVSAADLEKLEDLELYAWVEDDKGEQASAPERGHFEVNKLHFHVTPHDTGSKLEKIVLRLRTDDGDQRVTVPLGK